MLRTPWRAEKLHAILAEAISSGETLITFKTVSDAERFRFACYNLRRRTKDANLTALSFELTTEPPWPAIRIKRLSAPEMELVRKEPVNA